MVRYLSDLTGVFKTRGARSYPTLRRNFRPRAYVVLTREVGVAI